MTHLAFADRWWLPVSSDRVFAALAEVDDYPHWWPQVRRVARIDSERGTAHIRSLLPLTLFLELTREIEDQTRGRLRVGMTGDLVGYAEFVVTRAEGGAGTVADYRQEVRVPAGRLRIAVRVAPWLLRANHAHMMRGGQSGLRRHLARAR